MAGPLHYENPSRLVLPAARQREVSRMRHPWPELRWWDSGERQVVEEKIDDLADLGIRCNPEKKSLYRALRATPLDKTRVAIIGQDPYPTAAHATGLAFSVPRTIDPSNFPATLKIILAEYASDLGYSLPSHGDLSGWASQGVLLWNAIPSVQPGRPLSNDWDEWMYLTSEIVGKLAERGVVFAALGAKARAYVEGLPENNRVIVTSHPSPRGIRNSRTPFTGSRLFSTINAKLNELKLGTIDWEIKDDLPSKGDVSRTGVEGGEILQNITGADLGGTGKAVPNLWYSPKHLT